MLARTMALALLFCLRYIARTALNTRDRSSAGTLYYMLEMDLQQVEPDRGPDVCTAARNLFD